MTRINKFSKFAKIIDMGFQEGNKYWQFRDKHGKDPDYNPESLWDKACEYFQWVEDNPLLEARLTTYQGESKLEEVPKMRAMTFGGLFLFLDISHTTYDTYREKDDYLAITTRIDTIIRTQKFEGAAADLLNPNIIARDLGLVDKKQMDGEIKMPVIEVKNEKTKSEVEKLKDDND